MSSHQQHNDHGGSTTEFPSSLPPPSPMMSPTGNSSEEENETSPPPPLPSIYRILVEFAYKHIDFQMAELASVLHAHAGIDLHNPAQCRLHPRHQTFVVLDLVGSTSQHNNSNHNHNNAPKRPSPSDNVLGQIGNILVSQCTLVRSVVELWGMGESVHHCIASTRDFVTKHPHSLQPYIQPPSSSSHNSPSWKLTVHSLGSSLSMSEQATIRSQFSFLGFTGKVILNNPDQEFVFLQEVPLQHNLVTTNSSSSSSSPSSLEGSSAAAVSDPANTAETSPPNSPLASAPDPLQPIACYFGRVLGGIRHTKGRANLNDYLLSKRAYLGPTSMDAELSLIMASLAQIQSGSIVYDPFVGTGSILVACALRGASHCIGSDLDVRVLRGKHRNQNVYTNFAQFQLPRPELIRTDNALYHRHYRHHLPLYHAIVCDPPYGIRAGARKCGSKLDQPRPISEEQRIDHIPQTRPYPVCDVLADLMDVAARTLVLQGRLVYIIPSLSDFDPETDLPHHDCLRLVHSCFQPLSGDLGRRVVVMEKAHDYDLSQREHYLTRVWKHGPQSAEKVANLRHKINEAAKLKPHYEEKLRHRREKRKINQQAKKQAKKQSPPEQGNGHEGCIQVNASPGESNLLS